jgi:antitoxin MazE
MTTKLQKWGNSLGVRIPKEIVKKTKLKEGKDVSVRSIGDTIIITKAKKETFDELTSKITPKNRYKELYWGPATGNEVW